MNTRPAFDRRLSDWLDDGPVDAPDQILETVLAAFPSIPQRRPVLRLPWETSSLQARARLLAGIAAVVAISVGALVLRPGPSAVGPAQSVSPSPSASASPAVLVTYASSRFGYTIDHPVEWVVHPATRDWPVIGTPAVAEMGSFDSFGPLFGTQLMISSVPTTPGKDAAYWIALLDSQNATFCNKTFNRHDITLDGAAARQEDQVCAQTTYTIQVLAADRGRFFEFVFLSDGHPLTDADRATFEEVLASFRAGG